MKFANVAEIAVVAFAGLLTASSVAIAQPSQRDCWHMADSVKAALDAHPDASEDAKQEYQTGTQACTKGFTAMGIAHLQKAMKALGG